MIDKPVTDYALSTPMDEYISKNFQLHELVRSEIAARRGIDNSITNLEYLHNAIRTARRILQPIRDAFGPITPNSVYRCQELERALKDKPSEWVSHSQHTVGEAADIEVPGVTNIDLTYWVRANLEFDQLILECYDPAQGPNSGWVHVSIKHNGDNRSEVRSYVKNSVGRYEYIDGIITDTINA